MQNPNYTKLVKEARAAARDILRSEKVSALLGYLRNVEAKIKHIVNGRTALEDNAKKTLEVAAHELAKAEHRLAVATSTSDPDVDKITKATEAARKSYADLEVSVAKNLKRSLEDYDDSAAPRTKELEEKVKEYTDKIAKWNSGESKVCYADMETIALRLIRDKVATDFNMNIYEGADGDEGNTTETCETEDRS